MHVKNGLSVLMVPNGGWWFEQPLTDGGTQKLESSGYDELEKLVLDWRLQHLSFIDPERANLEDVRTDIRLHICKISPQNCLDKSGTAGFEIRQPLGNRTDHVPIIHKLNAWFALIQRTNRIEYAPAAVAQERALICIDCRSNIGWASGQCAPCNAAINTQSHLTRGSRALQEQKDLGACRYYGHLNEAAIWIEKPPELDEVTRPNVKPEDISPKCWMHAHEHCTT